ncbi:MAG: hypothetical protein R2838_02110 [Caldilineaceae bacterium]
MGFGMGGVGKTSLAHVAAIVRPSLTPSSGSPGERAVVELLPPVLQILSGNN